jgi:hypothetical protein
MQARQIGRAPTAAAILEVGDQVHVDGEHPNGSDGRIVGFYARETRRIVVMLPSGVQLIANESDVSLL